MFTFFDINQNSNKSAVYNFSLSEGIDLIQSYVKEKRGQTIDINPRTLTTNRQAHLFHLAVIEAHNYFLNKQST